WEEARDREAELRVMVARAEADLREAERRRAAAVQGAAGARRRAGEVAREADELRRGLEDLADVSGEAGAEIERLFGERDREAQQLSSLDARLDEVAAAIQEAAARARAAQKEETGTAEERHRLALRLAEIRSRAERVVERLEVEWGR